MRNHPLFMKWLMLACFASTLFSATADETQTILDQITLPNSDSIKSHITLPASAGQLQLSWTSSNEAIISASEKVGYNTAHPTPAGTVTRPTTNTSVTLTASATINDSTYISHKTVTVLAKPNTNHFTGYLYAYFSGDESRLDDQQIYFALSRDGILWTDLNENDPVLVSELGDLGVRDPYLIRTPEGDHFYLIATDLDIRHSKYGGDWGLMSTQGSNAIMVWESSDLVNWSAQRMVDISSDISAGNTWAPEAIYDEKTSEYLVYWSSRIQGLNFDKHRIYVAKTRDFKTFSSPKLYIETSNSCIDASILKVGDTYYRLLKDENTLNITLSASTSLLDYSNTTAIGNSFSKINNAELESYTGGYEGATMFQFIGEERWCALVDEYTNARRGYIPFISTDISATNSLSLMPDGQYLMPTGAKHGTVIPITEVEYQTLKSKWGTETVSEPPMQNPVLKYTFEQQTGNTITDVSGNGNNAIIYGNATIVNDGEMGNVLYLDGTANSYLEIPQGFFDGKDSVTISMDLKPQSQQVHHFTFTIGQDNNKYLFLRTRPDQIRNAITTLTYNHEQEVVATGSFFDQWVNITLVKAGHTMQLYIDTQLVSTNNFSRTISDLGNDLIAYLGKSFYPDPYFKGCYDNFMVYNRALSEDEVADIHNAVPHNSINKALKLNASVVTDCITFDIPDGVTQQCQLNLYNSVGQLALSKAINATTKTANLTTDQLATGRYVIRLTDKSSVYLATILVVK